MGSTMVALRATDSSADADPKAWYNRATSLTDSPSLAVGNREAVARLLYHFSVRTI